MAWELGKFDYPLGEHVSSRHDVSTLDELIEWMRDCADRYEATYRTFPEGPKFDGRGYIARSIKYHEDFGLVQTGCAPNYFNGLFTLATCRKDMRGEPEEGSEPNPNHPFRTLFEERQGGISLPRKPVFILTFSTRKQQYDRIREFNERYLANVSLITHGFLKMSEYANFLTSNYTGESVEKRLTHGGNQVARDRGDCHADRECNVYYPPEDHQHGGGEQACGCDTQSSTNHVDNSPHHVKCLSEDGFWIGWEHPELAMDRDNEFRTKNINGEETIRHRVVSI